MPANHRHVGVRHWAHRSRRGTALATLVVILLIVSAIVVAVWLMLRGSAGPAMDEPIVQEVIRGPYEFVVIEKGEVESANNAEVRCGVRARTGSGTSTSILKIVPEGTWVKKGDWLITFDSSTLEQERRQQQIAVNSRQATMIQAKAAYETAVKSLAEYSEGTSGSQAKTIDNEIVTASQDLHKIELSYDSTKRQAARGSVTVLQLDGEKFRKDAARNDLDLARRKMTALEAYSKPKMLTQLNSDVKAREVTYRNEQASYDEETSKLKEIDDQIAKCQVYAPQDGQVVYANLVDHHGSREYVVEAGAMVRERQILLNLPDPKRMQIHTEIVETRVNLIHEGQPVAIRVEAMGDRELKGKVKKVNKYADPSDFWTSSSKQFGALVEVIDPPQELRVGLTAEVRILVDQRDSALQVPVQAVYERDGKTYCLVQRGKSWDTRMIVIRSTNDRMVALDETESEAIQPGEMVVVNPREHVEKFDASRFATPQS
jgi:multidrug efflux pump subunit AcrA (membrane-fusion protein)